MNKYKETFVPLYPISLIALSNNLYHQKAIKSPFYYAFPKN